MSFGDNYFLFAASAAYLPFLIFGQIFYSKMHAKAISNTEFLFYIIATYLTALYGLKTIHVEFLRVDNSYLINFILAVIIFTFYYLINNHGLSTSRFITHVSSISYSLYLIHGVLGYWMMDIITQITNPLYSAIATTSFIYLFSTLTYNWIELRFIKFGKNFR
jgi:peptidoglycan/LPS O-acetylase OafA/YrhL